MLRLDHPHMLWLALASVPLAVIGWRAMAGMDRVRRFLAVLLRSAMIAAIAFMLAGPRMVREHDHLTVIALLDISGSVQRFGDLPPVAGTLADDPARRSNIEHLRRWFRAANESRSPNDRFGLVVFDGRAAAIAAPTRGTYVDDNLDVPMAEGTNIADAIRLGIALFPADSAKRLVLASDGNETAGSALEAVRHAGASDIGAFTLADLAMDDPAPAQTPRVAAPPRSAIPVDVLPIAYNVPGDVQVVRVEAPPSALAGQTVTVRIVLESTVNTSGTLALRREDQWVDMDPTSSGFTRRVRVPAGQSVHLAQVSLGQTPINRFEAIFEPDDPTTDALPDNNRAQAFTATPSRGSVLVIDGQRTGFGSIGGEHDHAIALILEAADIPVVVGPPEDIPGDLLSLQNYDLIILDNVAAALVPQQKQELLTRYVNDLGGGAAHGGRRQWVRRGRLEWHAARRHHSG